VFGLRTELCLVIGRVVLVCGHLAGSIHVSEGFCNEVFVVCTIWILASVLLLSGNSEIGGRKKLVGGAREFPEGSIAIVSTEAGFTSITMMGKIHPIATDIVQS
jgi:hypothetical protein